VEAPNIISTYTNEQAIEDGYKKRIDHPRRFGFTRPVTITSALFELLNTFPEGVKPDYELRELILLQRVGDLVADTIKANPDEYFFTLTHLIAGEEHDIWCVLDGDGYTIMLPSDY
jgi:hypothetical protein